MSEEVVTEVVETVEVVETESNEDATDSVEDQGSDSDENSDSEDSDTEEDNEQDGEEAEKKTPTKLTAEERKSQLQAEIQELANQKRALKEALDEEMTQKIQEEIQKTKETEAPPFVELDWDRLNEHVALELSAIDTLRTEGRATEALMRQRQLNKFYEQVEKNEQTRLEWVDNQSKVQETKKQTEATKVALNQAADIVRKSVGLSEEDWKLGEEWFNLKCKDDALLNLQYKEKISTQGPAHAVKWMADYVKEQMGAKAKEAKEKREEGKKKTVGGSTGGDSTASVPSTFDDLMKLSQDKIVKLEKSNPKLFNKLLSQKYK